MNRKPILSSKRSPSRKRAALIVVLLLLLPFLYFYVPSSVTDNLDRHVYELPFPKAMSFRVVQGYGGRFSHTHKAALDFSMPEGTPVCAARGGTIYAWKDSNDEGGPFARYEKKANYIIIRHDDGSFGCYWHLRKGGVLKKKGTVAAGQLIGYSGATGFVLRPHLHFAVKKALSYDKDAFIRTRFHTEKGTVLLQSGESYRHP